AMGAVGFAALTANAASFGLLWAYRGGDANMCSAWICTRNDVLGNLAVLLAAVGVFGTGTGWPDVIVAAIMAALALQGAWIVVQKSFSELHQPLPLSACRSKALVPFGPNRVLTGALLLAFVSARAVRTDLNGSARVHDQSCRRAGGSGRGAQR